MNNEDMSELFSKFSNMINEGNIPDDMKNILSSLGTKSNSSSEENASNNSENTEPSIDFETILKMKTIMENLKNTNDPRANLLLSLKPYLKESRKEKVDQYIKIFGMSKAFEAFNSLGNEGKNDGNI